MCLSIGGKIEFSCAFYILLMCSWIMFWTLVRLFNLKHFLFAVDFLKTWLPGENITVDIVSFLGYFMRTWLLGVSFIISSSLLLILLASWFVEFLNIDYSIQLKLLCVFAKPKFSMEIFDFHVWFAINHYSVIIIYNYFDVINLLGILKYNYFG
jgi:hypothetical protein